MISSMVVLENITLMFPSVIKTIKTIKNIIIVDEKGYEIMGVKDFA